jgi:hypothetical protein
MAEIKKYLHTLDIGNNKIINLLLNPLTTAERATKKASLLLLTGVEGYVCYDTDENVQYFWDVGIQDWVASGGGGTIPNLQQVTDVVPNGNITTKSIWLKSNYLGIENNLNGLLLGVNSLNTNPLAKILVDGSNGNLLFYFAGTEFTWRNISGNDIAYLRLDPGTLSELQLGTTNSASGIYINEVTKHSYLYLGDNSRTVKLKSNNITTTDIDLLLPNANGTLALSVNGVFAGTDGSITIPVGTGTVTDVTATSPITSSGGTAPVISTSMATNKLIGRYSANTGVMEEITVGTGLSLSAGTLNATAQFEQNFLLMGA